MIAQTVESNNELAGIVLPGFLIIFPYAGYLAIQGPVQGMIPV
jgi:hypothetical protein